MAVYICGKCRFTFERAGEISACPDCGKLSIREAMKEEIVEYKRIRQDLEWDD